MCYVKNDVGRVISFSKMYSKSLHEFLLTFSVELKVGISVQRNTFEVMANYSLTLSAVFVQRGHVLAYLWKYISGLG